MCNFFFFRTLSSDKVLTQSGEEYIERSENEFTLEFQNDQDCIEQKFNPQESYLKAIKIRFAVGWAGLTEKFVLQIELKKDGDVICSEQIDLYDEDNWKYYEFQVNQHVKKNQEYVVSIKQLEGIEDMPELSYTVFKAAKHVPENKKQYYYNGELQEGEFETCYVYEKIQDKYIISEILVNGGFILAVLMFVLIKKKLLPKYNNMLSYILWGSFPLILYILCEHILGNLYSISLLNHLKNLLLYYVVYFGITLTINHLSGIIFCQGILFSIITLVQYFTTIFRGRELFIYDFFAIKTAATVMGSYYFSIDEKLFLCLMICILLLSAGIIFSNKIIRQKKKRIIGAGGLAVAAALMIGFKSYWMVPVDMWDITNTYREAGNILTMISQIPYMMVTKPDQYSVSNVEKIVAENDEAESEKIVKTVPTNIILIMNESFSDLEYINEIETETELLPNWKSIEENMIKGYLYMPVFGAGTSNSEWEVLTGNTMNFMSPGVVPYQMNVKSEEMSLVSVLENQGYKTTALHPYMGENWNRNIVYQFMGFDTFYSEENWEDTIEYLRWTASDTSAYEKIINIDNESKEKQFLFLVTMQNHGGYADTWDNFTNEVSLEYETDYPQAEQYLSLMQESDRAFADLLSYYEKSDEPTMIVLFGDHQASIEEEFYEELYESSLDELSLEEKQSKYITPFMIWTNYDMEEKTDVEMSSNYFGSYILKHAGVNLSSYNQFLLEMMEKIPVIGVGGIKTKEGVWYEWGNIPQEYETLINNYKILQYNNIFDRENRLDEVFSGR